MVFSSLSFLFVFLPAVLLVYFAVPRQGKNAVLFAFSLLFYAWGEPIYVLLMIFSTILDYTCGRLVEKHRGEAKMQKNIISFGAYVSLFPQLIAGPIVRYRDIAEQLDCRTHSFDKFGDGVKRFVTGLGKKVLIANNIGLLWDAVSQTAPEKLTVLAAWLGIIAFAFQIYFDFSGYSDMAIGLGKIFGFDFPENFNYPYTSKSITEFWRRWHISLGAWFRDYVYIPLGGNRRGFAVQIRNIAVVWLLTGIWHGASRNFALWGIFYGVLLICEKLFLLKLLEKAPAFVGRIYTMLAVLLGWVLFAFDDLRKGFSFLGAMFGAGADFVSSSALYQLLTYLPLLLICIIASTPLAKRVYAKISAKTHGCVLLAAGIGASAFLPDKYYSESEKRTLKQFPALTAEEIFDGKLGDEIEQYLAEQFPARDGWVKGVFGFLV